MLNHEWTGVVVSDQDPGTQNSILKPSTSMLVLAGIPRNQISCGVLHLSECLGPLANLE